mmetsp:Transcript_13599/g.25548  ORF Transcript_13599/g.25548 Transcript_13599/m.25548 type:complete len:506 (+) Transcript_13599:419-1936(+)
MISSPQEKHIVQMSTSSISLMGSLTVATMILTSPTGLSSPYKRIIFGMSIADILQSMSLLTGPFSPPRGTPQAPWAIGNTATCDVNGFAMTAGSCAVPMYTCGLCIFYMCKLVYQMSDRKFARHVERYIHLSIILFNLCVGLVSFFTKTFNASPLAGFCYFAAFPQECNYPGSYNYGQCVRGDHAFIFIYISTITVPSLCLVGIFISMGLILHHAQRKARDFRTRYGQHWNKDTVQQHGSESYTEYLARLYVREAVTQSCLYVLGFVAIYIVPLVTCLKMLINVHSIDNSQFPILLVTFFPLGGLYNILVYTRPNVLALRRTEINLSWFQAFILVIRAGGEVPRMTGPASRAICCFCTSHKKSKSCPQQYDNLDENKLRHRKPPLIESNSQVNMASLDGMDSCCLDIDDAAGNTYAHRSYYGKVCIEPPNSLINSTPLGGMNEEAGNITVEGYVSAKPFTDIERDIPVLLIRLQGGDVSNVSSLHYESDVAEVEDINKQHSMNNQ